MDCQSLSQAYQIIARETALEPLLSKAISLLQEYSEAQLACILLKSEDKWRVEDFSLENSNITPFDFTSDCLFKSIIDRVAEIREIVCWNSEDEKAVFVSEACFGERQPRSILCVPLCDLAEDETVSDRDSLEAIVYLENSTVERVFTSEHIADLNLLSTPIAIAIAKARSEHKLSYHQQQIEQFLEFLPVGVEVFDAKDKLYYANCRAKALRAKGFIPEVCSLPTIIAEFQLNGADGDTLTENELQSNCSKINTLGDRVILVEGWCDSITDDKGKKIYSINAFRDLTEEKAQLLSKEYNRILKQQVEERTLQLTQALQSLQTAQNKLIQAEKMISLGQLVAGVAHEINTPLGVIKASSYNNLTALSEFLKQMPQLFARLSSQEQNLFFAFIKKSFYSESRISSKEKRQLKRNLQTHLEQQSIANARPKVNILADIGIYREIDLFLPLLRSADADSILQLAYNLARLNKNTNNAIIAIERASKVLFALKNYAHYDATGEKQSADIVEGIETVLELYHNQLKQGIKVVKDYSSVPSIYCYPDELIQVWTNLVHNGIQAMNGKGRLEISVTQHSDCLVVRITDSGSGVPPEIKDKIFQPFFTTKPMGEGSGLGLDIARKIIDKHQGNITLESKVGSTTFQVNLPL